MKKIEVVIKDEVSLSKLGKKLFTMFSEWISQNGYRRYILEKLKCLAPRKQKDENDRESTIILVDFEGIIELDDIVDAMIKNRFTSLISERYFVFGEQHPEIWNELPVATFNTAWEKDGDLYVPCYYEGSEKFPDMFLLNEPWGGKCLFAVSEN